MDETNQIQSIAVPEGLVTNGDIRHEKEEDGRGQDKNIGFLNASETKSIESAEVSNETVEEKELMINGEQKVLNERENISKSEQKTESHSNLENNIEKNCDINVSKEKTPENELNNKDDSAIMNPDVLEISKSKDTSVLNDSENISDGSNFTEISKDAQNNLSCSEQSCTESSESKSCDGLENSIKSGTSDQVQDGTLELNSNDIGDMDKENKDIEIVKENDALGESERDKIECTELVTNKTDGFTPDSLKSVASSEEIPNSPINTTHDESLEISTESANVSGEDKLAGTSDSSILNESEQNRMFEVSISDSVEESIDMCCTFESDSKASSADNNKGDVLCESESNTSDVERKSVDSIPITEDNGTKLMEDCVEENKTSEKVDFLSKHALVPKQTNFVKNSKIKSKTLDQVLSKIASKAGNLGIQKHLEKSLEQTKSSDLSSIETPKKAKARKSCASAKTPQAPVNPITSLTFNVKELEKKGLLDLPKAQKRKAFEPVKIMSGQLDATDCSISNSDNSRQEPIKSPVRSPVRSPGKSENPFFKKKKLIRRKKGKRGGYRLPGEKTFKKKIKDKEGDLNSSENLQNQNSDKQVKHRKKKNKNSAQSLTPSKNVFEQFSGGSVQGIAQSSMLNHSSNKNKSLSAQTPSNSSKKARKSVKSAESMRTIDSFFSGSNAANQPAIKVVSPNSVASTGSTGVRDSDGRKRKATGPIHISSNAMSTPDEKKRKVEESKSPPPTQLITLVPTGSPPISMSKLHPVMQSSVPGSTNPVILSPGTNKGPQTIIQNGTLNGLPMFQIVSGPSGPTSQPQLLTIGPGQGQSLLQNSFPRTTTLLQTNRMPMILAPVSVQPVSSNPSLQSQVTMSCTVISSASSMTPVANSLTGSKHLSVSSVTQGLQSSSELGSVIPQSKVYLSNGQLLDNKMVSKIGVVPNGLYPVTPPRTPENTSAIDLKENVELSPGGTPLPDRDIIPLCTCKINGANFQKLASLVTYCQAVDSIDGKVMGCCNKVTGSQVVRPAVKVPFLSLCESHRKRLRAHQCCPGCGHFCTQGRFLQCRKDGGNSLHLFHEPCLVIKDDKNYCPHCGECSTFSEVRLTLEESKPSIVKENKPLRVQVKARITAKTASATEESPEEPNVAVTLEKTKKTISTSSIPGGPDKHSLEKVLNCLGQERPKKFRHLPKCLYTPAYDQDLERTLYMLEDGHNPNEKYEDLESQSALHAAAIVGSLPVVHILVQAGASPHLQDKTLRTPLMYAAENNHLEVVKYLVKAGSIIDSKADDGMTALHYAAKAGHVEILRILMDTERIKVDVTDDGGWTPLIWAVEHDQIEAVKFLLKRNADPNLRDSEENTTLHWAAFSGSVVIAELLLTAGCDLDSLNMHGDRPLHIAARQDHYECVVGHNIGSIILAENVCIVIRKNPIENVDILTNIRLFLARGAEVEAKNNKGENPEECCPDKTTAVCLSLKVNRQLKKFGARHMGRPERLVHRDLSKGRENIPIPCVNAVDDDGVPQDYLYVTDNIETTSLNVNRVIGSLQSCQCKDDCSSMYCACGKNSVRCWYDKFGRLLPEFNMVEPPLIFECNRACTCWTTCNNRVVQNGVMSRLQVFKTDGRGWGCKTLVDIQRGTFICEYIGEHISDLEADRREDDSYLFDLDNRDGETYCIDARKYGNIARFINHLCEPNLVPVKVFVDSQDLRFPRICLFASRDILAGEELGFDYGEKFWIIKWKHFTCTCGSGKCRYSKDTIQKTLEEYHLRHDDEEGEVVEGAAE